MYSSSFFFSDLILETSSSSSSSPSPSSSPLNMTMSAASAASNAASSAASTAAVVVTSPAVGANVLIDGSVSPSQSSGVSSLGSSWHKDNLTEAEALLQLSNQSESDEGIVSDQSSSADLAEQQQQHLRKSPPQHLLERANKREFKVRKRERRKKKKKDKKQVDV